jgi:hypothetical protein
VFSRTILSVCAALRFISNTMTANCTIGPIMEKVRSSPEVSSRSADQVILKRFCFNYLHQRGELAILRSLVTGSFKHNVRRTDPDSLRG